MTLHGFVQALFNDGSTDKLQMAKLKGIRQNPLTGGMATHFSTRSVLSNLSIKFDFCCKGIHHIPRDIPKHLIKKLFPFHDCDVTSAQDVWNAILQRAKNTPVESSIHLK